MPIKHLFTFMAFFFLAGAVMASQIVYQSADPIRVIFPQSPALASDGLYQVDIELVGQVGVSQRIRVQAFGTPEIKVTTAEINYPTITSGERKALKIQFQATNATPTEDIPALRVQLDFAPDYPALLAGIANGTDIYPDAIARNDLLRNVEKAQKADEPQTLTFSLPIFGGLKALEKPRR